MMQAWYRRALASEARGRHGSALEDAREANKLMASHGWSSPQLNTLLQRLAESLLLATPSKPFKLHSASECPTEAVNGLQQDVAACELGAERSYRPSLDEALGAAAPGLSGGSHALTPSMCPLLACCCTTLASLHLTLLSRLASVGHEPAISRHVVCAA